MKTDRSALHRLADAYPEAFITEGGRAKPLYDISSEKSVLNHMRDATKNPMGRAISLAVLLDQMDSGEFPTTPEVRQQASDAFEKAFSELSKSTK